MRLTDGDIEMLDNPKDYPARELLPVVVKTIKLIDCELTQIKSDIAQLATSLSQIVSAVEDLSGETLGSPRIREFH